MCAIARLSGLLQNKQTLNIRLRFSSSTRKRIEMSNINFNDAQRMVINKTDWHSSVVSVPGSGKTGVIAEKAARLLSAGRSVTIVTFTRQAAMEVRERVLKAVEGDSGDQLLVGTFHSLVLRALRQNSDSPLNDRRIARPPEAERIACKALEAADLKASDKSLRELERARAKTDDPFGIERANEKALDDPVADSIRSRANSLEKASNILDAELERVGLIDMAGLLRLGLRFVQNGGTLFPGDHLLVDEGQDVDQVQLALIINHGRRGTIVDLVGDDDQAVYGFREGLGWKGVQMFEKALRAEPFQLNQNYRCRPEILDLAGEVIRMNDERVQKRLQAHKRPGGKVRLVYWPDNAAEAHGIAGWVQSMIERGEKSIGIIARQNWWLDQMEKVIGDRFDFVRDKGDDFWDCDPVGAVISFLRCVADPRREKAGLEQLLLVLGARGRDVDNLRANSPDGSIGTLLEQWTDDPTKTPRTTAYAMEGLVAACRACGYPERPRTDVEVDGVLEAVHGALIIAFEDCGFAADEKIEVIDGNIRRINAAFRTLGRLKGSLGARITLVTMAAESQDKVPVRLMTMHSSKGLEFDHVSVIGCESDTIPGRNAIDANLPEERRLMYIAMTRARENLLLSYPSQVQRRGVTRVARKSQILDPLRRSLQAVDGTSLRDPWSDGSARLPRR